MKITFQKTLFTVNISHLFNDREHRCPFISFHKGKRQPNFFIKKYSNYDFTESTSYYFYSLEDFKKTTNISEYLKEFIFDNFSKKLASF